MSKIEEIHTDLNIPSPDPVLFNNDVDEVRFCKINFKLVLINGVPGFHLLPGLWKVIIGSHDERYCFSSGSVCNSFSSTVVTRFIIFRRASSDVFQNR